MLSIPAISIEKYVAAKVCIFGEKLIVAKTGQIYIQLIIFHSNESFLLASFLPPNVQGQQREVGGKWAILIE